MIPETKFDKIYWRLLLRFGAAVALFNIIRYIAGKI